MKKRMKIFRKVWWYFWRSHLRNFLGFISKMFVIIFLICIIIIMIYVAFNYWNLFMNAELLIKLLICAGYSFSLLIIIFAFHEIIFDL